MPEIQRADSALYYEAHGEGPALVLAHGAGGNRVSWWQQLPHFAARHRVIAFDHRGFGRSRCPDAAWHPRHFAGDLFAILDAEGIERAALVCQSMGGWTGLRAALERPERVRALVLAGTPGGLLTPRVLEAMQQIGAGIGEQGIRGNAALAPDFPRRRPELAFLYDQINGLNLGFEPRWLARMFEESARIDPERARALAVPTRVLSGSEDQLFPPKALAEVAEVLGAELCSFPGVGHSTYFEDAPAFNRNIDEFLAAHP